MCGIIGVLTRYSSVNEILLHGLIQLQNRGYDSMGVSLLVDKEFVIKKQICIKECRLIEYLKNEIKEYISKNGIGHSRWATHGKITIENAHPHLCYQGLFSLVHNGIIENYKELKEEILLHQGIMLKSQTDSEIIIHLISLYFSQLTPSLDIESRVNRAIFNACKLLQGTFALVIQYKQLPDKLFCIRYGSPLVVGFSDDIMMVSSEKSAFTKDIDKYTTLDDHDLVIIDIDGKLTRFSDTNHEYILKDFEFIKNEDVLETTYRSWTEKEIKEQPLAIQKSLNFGSRILPEYYGVQLGGLNKIREDIRLVDHLVLMGCGTSYYACLLASAYFRKWTELDTVQVIDGSEFDELIISKKGKTCMIVVSQSGETIDLLKSIERFRRRAQYGIVVGVVNVVDSLIARSVDAGVYTNCGKEKGVASTKSFTTQITVLILIAIFFCRTFRDKNVLRELNEFVDVFEQNMDRYFATVKDGLVEYIAGFSNIYIIGKSFDYHVALEGSLKIKEITYIHSEAYSSSSLKHGPFALLNKDMLVILISTVKEERKKIVTAHEEIIARNAPVLIISYENIMDCPRFIKVNDNHFSYLEANCILQILAHEISLFKGINPDFPRNLAKVVTVE